MEKKTTKNKTPKFLEYFPDHLYRFIDQTGAARFAISAPEYRKDLNEQGYDAFFTVNGFKNAPDAKREHCTSLNAFFVDIDGRKDEKELEAIKARLLPTFIIETMRGYHIYWCLDEYLFKEDMEETEWAKALLEWEQIEATIVKELNADPVVKDLTRILRVPDSYYWKKSGDAWKQGVKNAPFKIKGVYKNVAATYSFEQVKEAFPFVEEKLYDDQVLPTTDKMKRYAEAEKADFFARVDKKYPIEDRPSFEALISGKKGTLPDNVNSRNEALLVTASLMKRAGWKQADAVSHILKVGWHGIEKERGGDIEIKNTIASAWRGGYTYSIKHPVIAHVMDEAEERKMNETYTAVLKDRKELDKTRFVNYEHEILAKYPNLKKNEAGVFFDYKDGVYKMLSKQEISNIVLSCMYEDMLWGYRTTRNVSDKVACLLSIVPDLELTNDKGRIVNVKNGLLDIVTKELKPHTPAYVSLAQSPVAYDPNAKCPIWDECIKAWMEGPEAREKTFMLQQFAGYCLSSSMKYAKALFLVGDGGNGKSTFADTIAMVIGSEATSRIDLEDIYSQFGLAGLIGKRLNIVEEVSGNYYQSHKLKKLVSGEEVTVNMKYKEQFKFLPQAKFIFAVNTMPQVDDSSVASERRILAVQFNNNFRDRPNTELRFADGQLAKELSGILNWMLAGVQTLREEKGFYVSKEQKKLLEEYRQENSSVEGFIVECLELKEGESVDTRKVYDVYKEFCKKDGRKHKKKSTAIKEIRAFAERNGTFSFIERLNGHDVSKFEGVIINSEWASYATSLSDF